MKTTTPPIRIAGPSLPCLGLTLAFALAGCGDVERDGAAAGAGADTAMTDGTTIDTLSSANADGSGAIRVELEPTEGHRASGTVTVTETDGGVRVNASITRLTEGDHGFHIHENGDCSAPDASSAGGHFAQEGSRHGGPDAQPPEAHVGDMGNITADASGIATFDREFRDMTLEGPRGIMGRAIVVHSGADDMESQPSGNAGERVACGVISGGGQNSQR